MRTTTIKTLLMAVIAVIVATSCMQPGRWPNGKIPYILIGFNDEEQATIIASMYLWEQSTGVDFQNILFEGYEKTTNVLHILKGDETGDIAGMSVCGYDENKLHMTILANITQQTVVHEMGHVLGLTHEHQRPDRDSHIVINWDNISGDASIKMQFMTDTPKFFSYKKYKYDFYSCMHYSNNSASISPDLNTIDSPVPVGIYDMPSRRDIKKVKEIQGTH